MKNLIGTYRVKESVKNKKAGSQKRITTWRWKRAIAPAIAILAWMLALKYSMELGGLFLYELSTVGFIVAMLLVLHGVHGPNHQRN